MEKYNLDKLIKVVVNDFYPSRWYYFKPEKKIFGKVIRKEGFYNWIYHSQIGMEAPKNHIIKDNQMFEKPKVVLGFQGNNTKKYFFDTYDEAKTFASNLTNDRKWIS